MKIVHVVFGDAALSRLRAFLRNDKQSSVNRVFCYRDDLSIGPISELNSEMGLSKRISYVKNVYKERNQESSFEAFIPEIGLDSICQFNFKKYDRVIIWHGNNVQDKLLLYAVCALLPDVDLHEAAITDDIKQHGYSPIKIAECSYKSMSALLDGATLMSPSTKQAHAAQWTSISQSNKLLRILNQGNVVNVEESYYDSFILSDCTEEFTPADQIVGNVMGTCGQSIGDAFLNYRVKGLVKLKELCFKGDLLALSRLKPAGVR